MTQIRKFYESDGPDPYFGGTAAPVENKEVLVEGKEPCKHESLTDTILNYYKEWEIEGKEVKEESPAKVTRIEVINHSKRGKQGLVFTDYDVKDFELSYQDNGRTLKIFINK